MKRNGLTLKPRTANIQDLTFAQQSWLISDKSDAFTTVMFKFVHNVRNSSMVRTALSFRLELNSMLILNWPHKGVVRNEKDDP
jgi:hypothetical protein